jgi:pimeloyl-ACP methyl ester carboxylesterase
MSVVLEHVAIDVRPGVVMESQSGLQNLRPRIYGVLGRPASSHPKTAALIMHPTSNYMGHYLVEPLAAMGVPCLALNSRYVGNDALLQMERVILDLGAGVQYLRDRGYEKIILIGNSGGGALAAFYQSEAENLTVHDFIEGGPTGVTKNDLPPADGIILSAAHPGRAQIFAEWVDPAVTDENDPFATNLELDIYDGPVKPPFTPEFVARFRAAQLARRARIEAWVEDGIASFKKHPSGPADRFFIINRTHSDPRLIDLSLDSNDRKWGSVWGDPRTVNYAANAFGRVTSFKAFLSQLSSRSRALGPANLERTSVPVLLLVHTADASTFPSTRAAWQAAAQGRVTTTDVKGGNHYLVGQNDLIAFSANTILSWIDKNVR